MLEELRLLTNLETPTQKLLQIVLSGQNELDRILARPSLRQLKQRVTLRCKTFPLSHPQTAEYMARRIHVAGGQCSQLFDPESIELIHRYSGGIVRLINLLCEQALINAFCDSDTRITAKHIEYAARELELGEDRDRHSNFRELDNVFAQINAKKPGLQMHDFEPMEKGTTR
jgi:type II secretory pathway predicted ATPase ExeA